MIWSHDWLTHQLSLWWASPIRLCLLWCSESWSGPYHGIPPVYHPPKVGGGLRGVSNGCSVLQTMVQFVEVVTPCHMILLKSLQMCWETWWGRKGKMYWWDQHYYILQWKFPQSHDLITWLADTSTSTRWWGKKTKRQTPSLQVYIWSRRWEKSCDFPKRKDAKWGKTRWLG